MPTSLHFPHVMETYRPLLCRAGFLLAGFSGGPDSSCLLHLLNGWCRENGIFLAAAHVHHGIRGAEADRDEAFCRGVCETLGIPYYVCFADVPALAREEKAGLEETARRVRYDFFEKTARSLSPACLIVTAHNADDNLETVLFHLLRGSGLRGLCGIDPFRDDRYLRPLLYDSSADIRTWCAENSVPFVLDSTNTDTAYARNHIRHRILPELRVLNEHPAETVSRMTALLRQDEDFLQQQAAACLEPDAVSVSRAVLASQHPAIASRVLRMLAVRASQSGIGLPGHLPEDMHIRRCLDMLREKPGPAFLSLPGKRRYVQTRDVCRMEWDDRVQPSRPVLPASGTILFSYPADGLFFRNEGFSLHFSRSPGGNPAAPGEIHENIYKLSILTTLRFDKIKGVLRIRTRAAGDIFVFGGHTHKVRRLFIDRKWPEPARQLCPILCDDDGIVWIPSFPVRDGLLYRGEGEPLSIRCLTDLLTVCP